MRAIVQILSLVFFLGCALPAGAQPMQGELAKDQPFLAQAEKKKPKKKPAKKAPAKKGKPKKGKAAKKEAPKNTAVPVEAEDNEVDASDMAPAKQPATTEAAPDTATEGKPVPTNPDQVILTGTVGPDGAIEASPAPVSTPVLDPVTPPEPEPEPILTSEPLPEPGPEQSPAESRLGIQLAPKVGLTIPVSDLGLTTYGSLEAGFDLVMLKPVLGNLVVPGIALEFAYIEPGLDGDPNAPQVGGDYRFVLWQRIMVLSVDALFTFELGALHPYAGLGYSLVFLHANMRAFGLTNVEDQIRSGFQGRLGLGYELWMGDVFLEMRFHEVGLAFLSTGDASARSMTASAGYRFRF